MAVALPCRPRGPSSKSLKCCTSLHAPQDKLCGRDADGGRSSDWPQLTLIVDDGTDTEPKPSSRTRHLIWGKHILWVHTVKSLGTAGLSWGYWKVKALDPNLPKSSKAGTEPQQHSQASEFLFSVYFFYCEDETQQVIKETLMPWTRCPAAEAGGRRGPKLTRAWGMFFRAGELFDKCWHFTV